MSTTQTTDSTAVATTGNALPDLSKAANLVKFAGFWDGKKLDRLSPEQQTYFLATLGQHIGVRAELGEILLYQGKPYITIDGRIRIANNTGLLDGIQPRPATRMECENYGCQDGDALWVAYIFKKGTRRAFVGWGHVRKDDRNPVSKTHPRQLAKKRAVYDALRAAFPAKEDIGPLHERYVDEAEETATATRPHVPALASGDYADTDELGTLPDDVVVAGEEIAADAAVRVTDPNDPRFGDTFVDDDPVLPLGDTRATGKRNALAEGH